MKNVIAYVHTHWDREWYREFEEFRLRLIEVFNEIITALENNELPCFYFDGQTAALEDYLEIFPERTERIKKLIKLKKLRIGPFYCSCDSFLSSGESLYRNLEIGLKKSKEFGETEFLGYLSDTFGHSAALPYIFKSLNIDKACLWRGLGNLSADFEWNGINVTYLIQGYFQDFLNSNLPIEKKAELLKNYLDKISLKSEDNILLPIGADHLGLAKNLTKQIEKLNEIYNNKYNINIKTPFEYFDKIKNRKKVNGEFLNNELNFILSGVYSSRLYLKQANAYSQWKLSRVAEPLQSIVSNFYNSDNKQNEINYAYKLLIKNHAHDSIYGCSTDEVHDEVMGRYKKVNSVSDGIIKRSLRELTNDKGELSIINLSNFEYSGKVFVETEKQLPKQFNALKISSRKGFTDKKLYNIQDIPVTEDYTEINKYLIDVKGLKPFSITKITQDNICEKEYITCTKNSIENAYLKIEIKNNKINITDKKTNTTYNNFISFYDRADIGDSYNFGALLNDKPILAEICAFKLKEFNNKRAVLNVIYKIKIPANSSNKGRIKKVFNQKINVEIFLYNQSEFMELTTNWKNKSKNHIFQIGFNLKNKIHTTISEDLFGTVKRSFNPDFDIYNEIPAKRGKEIKPNTAPLQRFVSAQNVSILTKGLNEYEINKNTLAITLLRATGIISNPKNPTRGTPAGPPIETPKLQCLGENNANLAIAFTSDENEMYKFAEEFYCANQAVFTNTENKVFFELPQNVLLYSAQKNDKGINLRLFNNSDEEKIIYSQKINPKAIANIQL